MSEKRFLKFVLLEGLILTTLGLCVLILPKITELSFGVMLSASFITYGLYKIFSAFMNRNYARNFLMLLFLGFYILTLGILLLLVPKVSLLWLIAMIGVYFLLESLSTHVFMSQIRNMYNFWECKYFSAVVMFLIGFLIIIAVPAMSFWLVAMLSGVGLLIKGMCRIAFYNANRSDI